MKLSKLVSLVAVAAALVTNVSAASANQLEAIKEKAVLKVAVPQDFPPLVLSERI